jgi:hypothetical protein
MPRKIKTLIPTPTLRRAFLEMLRKNGQQAERVGETLEVYKLPDGKTFRLRTNNQPALMAKVASGDVAARLPFEGENYVGVAFPAVGNPHVIVCYLVPSDVAAKAIRVSHKNWMVEKKTRSRDNQSRLLRFDGRPDHPSRGFEQRWHQYLIGEIDLDALPPEKMEIDTSELTREIMAAKKHLAGVAGVPVNAVSITISY